MEFVKDEVMKKLTKNSQQRGQSLVEVAISLTLLIVIVGGIVDLGRAFFSYISIRDAAQEGAIFGSLAPYDLAGLEKRVRESSDNPVNLRNTNDVTISPVINGGPCGGSGNSITVTVTYNFEVSMPMMGTILGGQSFPLSARVNNLILRPPYPASP